MADHDDKLTASEEALLESFFSAARSEEPAPVEPSPDLLARVLTDGYGVQDGFAAPAPQPAPAPRRGVIATLFSAVGGAPGLAGLTAAALAGVWIGARPPESVSTAAASLFGSTVTEAAAEEDLLGYDMAFADLLTDG